MLERLGICVGLLLHLGLSLRRCPCLHRECVDVGHDARNRIIDESVALESPAEDRVENGAESARERGTSAREQ